MVSAVNATMGKTEKEVARCYFIYVNDKFQYSVNNDINITGAESKWIELKQKGRIIIGCVYRPPSTDKEKQELYVEFDRLLKKFTQASEECIIVGHGDFNIDISIR